jgi:hypothetical protein
MREEGKEGLEAMDVEEAWLCCKKSRKGLYEISSSFSSEAKKCMRALSSSGCKERSARC